VELLCERLFAYRHLFALPAAWAGVRKETVRRTLPCNIRQHFMLGSPPFFAGTLPIAPNSEEFFLASVLLPFTYRSNGSRFAGRNSASVSASDP